MKTVSIEDDVYEFLLKRSTRIGESASDILRRELKIRPNSGNTGNTSPQTNGSVFASGSLGAFLQTPEFLVESDALGKFLAILSCLHKQDPKKFPAVLNLTGRKRRYFGSSANELEKYGNSVMPRQIKASPYWVISNTDTPKKRQMLSQAMRVLGYDSVSIDEVTAHLK